MGLAGVIPHFKEQYRPGVGGHVKQLILPAGMCIPSFTFFCFSSYYIQAQARHWSRHLQLTRVEFSSGAGGSSIYCLCWVLGRVRWSEVRLMSRVVCCYKEYIPPNNFSFKCTLLKMQLHKLSVGGSGAIV